ncbi:unnamed protein product [Kuraishia capsulata CBS 1993]|uniref:Uncharacterized protein n=1 Tax=Kuraishia capsulata CBS 1993 TaxID=1382522 RepID=W6MU24_9ASCO|nr:uncharacterized protein KUCA_T00001359001 [Kuraishia capsulata CBS 1993]CDK25390.1 unnamed protein product [Kuraishia capsulata CBS 1993]
MKIPLNSALVDNCHKDPFQQEDQALHCLYRN